jgi:hypothetical protein
MVVTNTGKNEIRDWLAGSAATAPTRVAVGNDSTPASEDDTTLASELQRMAFNTTDSSVARTVTYEALLDSTEQNGETLKEVGLLNAVIDGDLFLRVTHASLQKTSAIDVQYLVTIEVK